MTPHFKCTGVFEQNWESDKYITINRGGTRSSKTWSLAQLFIALLFEDVKGKPKVLSIVRKTLPALKASVMRDVIEILVQHDLYKLVEHNRTENFIKFRGNLLEFFSLDNEQKVRGRKRTHLWINEANEIDYEAFKQLIFRTNTRAYLDFNPDDDGVWINTELEQRRANAEGFKDVKVIVSSYLDNSFLDPQTIANIEYLKIADPEAWKVFGIGEYGRREGVVFENYTLIDEIPETAALVARGLDFGFTNDPTAVVSVYKQDGKLWIDELLYERNLTNQDISQRLHGMGLASREEIIADSAEPKSIEEIYRYGFNVKPAQKGADSINASIDTLKGYQLMITARSENLIKELRTYKWQKDKNGVTLNKPVDYNNHAIDALRYVALNKLTNKKQGKYIIR